MTSPPPLSPTSTRSPSAPSPAVLRSTGLVVLGETSRTFRCREVATDLPVTLRAYVQEAYPGTVVTVDVLHEKTLKKGLSIDGKIRASRIDIPALKLHPLSLSPMGISDLDKTLDLWVDWGQVSLDHIPETDEDDDSTLLERLDPEDLPFPYRDVLKAGPRPIYEMEQVIPGTDPDDEWDPIVEAAEIMRAGGWSSAWGILHGLLSKDLRCIDAYSHLGFGIFNRSPEVDGAVRYYEIGVAIGDSFLRPLWTESPPDRRTYLLPWGFTDNRPYLRCLEGLALCRWRQNRWDDATRLFTDLFWLDPSDRLGTVEVLSYLESRTPWSALP